MGWGRGEARGGPGEVGGWVSGWEGERGGSEEEYGARGPCDNAVLRRRPTGPVRRLREGEENREVTSGLNNSKVPMTLTRAVSAALGGKRADTGANTAGKIPHWPFSGLTLPFRRPFISMGRGVGGGGGCRLQSLQKLPPSGSTGLSVSRGPAWPGSGSG